MSTIDSQNMLESELRSLRVKQKKMEATIRRQDETISKLNDDNQFFKTQLNSLTKTLNGTLNTIRNKDLGPSSTINIMDDSLSSTNESPTKLNNIYQSSLKINKIPLSGEKDQQTNLNRNVIADVEQSNNSPSTHTDKAPQSKQKEIININKTPNSKSQTQESLNPNAHNNTQINFKSTIPCPFLSRRGWCIKQHNCKFKHPEQSKSSSSTYTDKAPLSKQRETINMHRNKTLNSRLQTQQPPNTNMHNNAQINLKSTTPCPFLSRRGWCIKKNNCDFKHPESLHLNEPLNNVPKHRVRCLLHTGEDIV